MLTGISGSKTVRSTVMMSARSFSTSTGSPGAGAAADASAESGGAVDAATLGTAGGEDATVATGAAVAAGTAGAGLPAAGAPGFAAPGFAAPDCGPPTEAGSAAVSCLEVSFFRRNNRIAFRLQCGVHRVPGQARALDAGRELTHASKNLQLPQVDGRRTRRGRGIVANRHQVMEAFEQRFRFRRLSPLHTLRHHRRRSGRN